MESDEERPHSRKAKTMEEVVKSASVETAVKVIIILQMFGALILIGLVLHNITICGQSGPRTKFFTGGISFTAIFPFLL